MGVVLIEEIPPASNAFVVPFVWDYSRPSELQLLASQDRHKTLGIVQFSRSSAANKFWSWVGLGIL